MEINLYAESFEGRELQYSEIEAVAMYDSAMNSFRQMCRVGTEMLYAEADESTSVASDGFFKKIINFFKKLAKQIIEFIKKVARKTLEILTKPFGTKMKAANSASSTGSASGGGGGGAAVVSSDSPTQTSNPMTMKFANLVELGNLQKTIIRYLLGKHEVSWDNLSKSGFKFEPINTSTIYKESDFNDVVKELANVGGQVVDICYALATMDTGIGGSKYNDDADNNPNVRNHPEMACKFEAIKGGNRDKLTETVMLYSILGPMLEDIVGECVRISNRADKLSEKEKKAAKQIQDELDKTLEFTNSDKAVASLISKVDKIKTGKIFGKPALEMLKMRRLAILCSGGETVLKAISQADLNKYLGANGRGTYNFKNAGEYAKTLTEGTIVDTSVLSSLFTDVSFGAGAKIEELLKANFTLANISNYLDLLKESLDKLSKMNQDTFIKDDKGNSKAGEVEDKLEKGLSVKGATDAWKALLGGCSKIIKNLGNQSITLCQDVRQLYSNLEGAQYIKGSVYAGNKALYKWDYVNYGIQTLEKLLADKTFTDKVFNGSEDKIKDAKFKLNQLRDENVTKIKARFGKKTVD